MRQEETNVGNPLEIPREAKDDLFGIIGIRNDGDIGTMETIGVNYGPFTQVNSPSHVRAPLWIGRYLHFDNNSRSRLDINTWRMLFTEYYEELNEYLRDALTVVEAEGGRSVAIAEYESLSSFRRDVQNDIIPRIRGLYVAFPSVRAGASDNYCIFAPVAGETVDHAHLDIAATGTIVTTHGDQTRARIINGEVERVAQDIIYTINLPMSTNIPVSAIRQQMALWQTFVTTLGYRNRAAPVLWQHYSSMVEGREISDIIIDCLGYANHKVMTTQSLQVANDQESSTEWELLMFHQTMLDELFFRLFVTFIKQQYARMDEIMYMEGSYEIEALQNNDIPGEFANLGWDVGNFSRFTNSNSRYNLHYFPFLNADVPNEERNLNWPDEEFEFGGPVVRIGLISVHPRDHNLRNIADTLSPMRCQNLDGSIETLESITFNRVLGWRANTSDQSTVIAIDNVAPMWATLQYPDEPMFRPSIDHWPLRITRPPSNYGIDSAQITRWPIFVRSNLYNRIGLSPESGNIYFGVAMQSFFVLEEDEMLDESGFLQMVIDETEIGET